MITEFIVQALVTVPPGMFVIADKCNRIPADPSATANLMVPVNVSDAEVPDVSVTLLVQSSINPGTLPQLINNSSQSSTSHDGYRAPDGPMPQAASPVPLFTANATEAPCNMLDAAGPL
jgi:hypothetical protein